MFGKPLLFLAGYLASEEQWAAFSSAWTEQVLKAYSIPFVHAAELRSKRSGFYRHLDITARRQLLHTACGLIGDHVDAGFGTYMRPADLLAITTPQERARWGGAYGMCTELLLCLVSKEGGQLERINVFLEKGHANAGSALKRIEYFKYDSEPIEWPDLLDPAALNTADTPENRMRLSAIRIGKYGVVTKKAAPATQAADLFAYFATTTFRNDDDPVFSGIFDNLVSRTKHALSPWGPQALAELVNASRYTEERRHSEKSNLYALRGLYHAQGLQTHVLPWGLVIDKGPADEQSAELRRQLDEIRTKL